MGYVALGRAHLYGPVHVYMGLRACSRRPSWTLFPFPPNRRLCRLHSHTRRFAQAGYGGGSGEQREMGAIDGKRA